MSFIFALLISTSVQAQSADYHRLCQAFGKAQITPCSTIQAADTKQFCNAGVKQEAQECLKVGNADMKKTCVVIATSKHAQFGAAKCNEVLNLDWKAVCTAWAAGQEKPCMSIPDIHMRGLCFSIAKRGDFCIPLGTDPKTVPFEPRPPATK